MATKDPKKPIYARQVNVTLRTVQALDRVLAELRGARVEGKAIGIERLVNASWLWFETMDAAELELALMPFLVRYEAIRAGKPDPGMPPIVAPGTTRGRRRATRLNPAVTLPPPSGREPDEPDPAPAERHSRVKRAQ